MTGGKITFANGGEYEVSERVIQTMDPEDNTTPMVVTELTNAHTSQTVKVQATKVWADEKNADGLRKDIHFKLVGTYTAADNKTYTVENIANATQTVKAADTDLTKTWDNLPKYYDGKEIVYTVVEVETPEGYTGAYYKDGELSEEVSEGQLTYNKETKVWEVWVKNEHIVNKIDISATKAWNDGNAPAVHETIKLKLSSAPEVEIKEPEKTIDSKAAGSGLTVSWIGLPEYKDGEKVVYTVTETQGDARYTANVGEITYAYDAAKQLYTGTVTVTNTPIRNMLKLHKAFSFQGTALNPSELTDAQKKNLSFTVTTQLGGKTYYAVYDKETSAEAGNIHGKYAKLTTQASSFTYADFSDGMLVLENLPVGTYTVTENGKDMLEGYTWSQAAYKVGRNGTEKTEKEPETVTVNGISVSEGDFTQVFFTNEYTEKVGEIKVVKEVSVHEKDIAIDANKLYRVAVYRLMKDGKDDPAGSKMYYTTNGKVVTESDAAISNRNLWVELKAGDSNAQLWKNLPVGTYYVEEYANSAKVEGYTVTTTVAPEKVEVTTASKGDSAVSLKVKNDYEQDRGELNIEKRIFVDDAEVAAPQTGETASEDYTKMKDTAFYVKVAYKDANGVTWYVTDSNGSLSKDPKVLKVTLAAPLNIKHAPAGLYTITEVKEDGSKLEDGKDGEIKLLAGISTTKATAVVEKGKEGSAEIINRYTSDKFAVVVRKVWQDENNRDDLRPKSIQVSLYRSSGVFQELLDWFTGHGTKIGDYTLNEENNWTQVVTGLPRYGFLGNYAYRWFETNKINGYTTTISRPSVSTDHMTEITTITNTHEAAKVEIEANKIWRNGTADVTATIKNASVTFTLQQKVEGGDWQHVLADQGTHGAGNPVALAVQDEAKLDAWKVTWKNLPKLSGGKAIAYRVVESGAVPEGAAATSDTVEVTFDGDKGTATLTNTLPATKVQVNKVWNDNDNQDGFRPDAVKVQLMHGTAKVGSAVTLDEDSQWKHVWTGVNRYDENGDEIVYSVVEVDDEGNVVTEIKRGNTSIYGVSVSDIDSEGNITVTNTHVTELTNIRITKVWDDQDDQDGVRPQTVTIYLDRQVGDKAKEEGYKYITLAETDKVDEDEWSYVFANLPKYEGGEAIVYSVREEKVTGYETNIEKDDTGEVVTVTNTHTPALVTISITKKWDDDHDRDKVRPAGKDYAKLVHLFADGKEVTNETTGYQEMTQTVTENQDDTFTVTYAKLPQFTNGAEIVYTVQEDAVTGYKADLKEVKNGETLTNTHELARVKITITKVWNDNANHDGKRPDTEQFKQYLELMAGTEKITAQTTGYEQMTLSVDAGENNTYIITYDGLLKFDPQGKAIDYTVNEATVPDGYQVEGESTAAPEGSIINKKDNELIEVSITKLWKDDQNRDGKRPTAKEYENSVQLLANGKEVTAAVPEYEGMTKVVKDQGDNTYTVTFSQLPKYAAGVEITYTVKEGEITGYTTDTPVVAVDGTIINTHIPDRYCVAVAKTWVDLDNRFHSRPAAGLVVTLQKSSDSGKTWVDVQDATLTEANGYAYMVQGVPAFEEGKELLYRWTEKKENIPSGYTHGEADEKNVQNGTITLKDGSTVNTDILTVLTNTLDLVQVPVTKVWNDDNNRDGKRPGAVTVRLFKTVDGKKDQVMLFTLSEADAEVDQKPWSHVFTDLPKYENGKEITYTVEEDQVTDYAEPIINGSAATGFIVTNVHQSERIKITANKIWNDNHNQDGKRGQITLVLSGRYIDADGEEQTVTVNSPEKTIRLDAPRNVAWSNLYKYENGHEILYSVTEKGMSLDDSTMVLNGATYYVSISGNALDGFTVINSYEPKQYAVAVSKTWEDMDNSFGTRPETITVTLQKRVGSGAWTDVKTATLSETNGWAYIEENLPAYESGKLLSYRWTEKSVPKGYEKVREEQIEGTVVINGTSMQADVLTAITNKLETVNVMVTKVWKDEFDADHIRPNTLEVKLKGSNTGSKVLDKVLLAPANNWTAVVEKLPAVDKTTGEKIVYTWDETDSDNKLPAGYELTTADPKTTPQDDKNYEHTILTNTHEVMRTQVTLTKKWVGDDHRASERAASFQLKADGNAYGAMVTLKGSADEAEATYVWENLPVYSDPATKKNEIQYTVEEVNPQPYYDVTGGELTGDAESGYEVVFVNTQQTSDLAVQKKVDSEALADATEKFTFTVTLTPAIEGTFGGMTFNASGVASFQLSGGETKIAEGLPAGISYKVEENPADNFVTTAQNEEGTLAPDGAQVLFVNKKITSGFVVTKKVVSALNKDVDPEQTKFDFTVVLDGATVTGTYGDMQFKDGKATFQLGNGETKTAENLPVGITYTVTESANPNFDTAKTGDKGTVTANQAGVASFVNTRKTGKLELTKKVSSAVPGDQQRLFAFKITLKNGDQWLTGVYSNYTFGKEGEARVWLKANETVTIKDIPVGTDYTIEEEPDPDALFTASPASTKGMITVETLERKETFTNTRKTGTLKITKTVVNPVEGEEDKTFVFIVTVDPAVQKGTYGDAAFDDAGSATVRIQGSGSATIKDLPQGVNYRVVEASDDAYVMTGEVGNIGTITEIGSEAKFTNVRKTTQFKVTKIWVDADNQDGKRDEVKIELLKNGKVVDTKPLNESGVALWTDLPETELDGKKIEYTFHEAGEAEGKLIMKDEAQYSVTYGDNTVTNTYIPETTSISVLKVWDDANDQDGKRASVNATLTLYKSQENGEPTVVETVNVPYTGGLVKAWDNLPVYEHGKKLTYSVKETIANTSCKYESDYAEATDVENNSTVTVTNRYTPETTKITIIKHWDDADDQDGKRAGAQASATLYRKVEGSAHEPVDVVTVGLEDGWEKTWDELPVYKDGKKITYSVVEAVGNGYTSSLTGKTDVENGAKLEITNSYTPEVTTITITKNWDDAEDQDGIREKVKAVVMVYAIDGAGKKTLVEEAQVPDANGTVFERTDLPVYSKGQKLTYTAVEILSENSGYVSSQATEGEIKNGELHITNIHTPAVTEAGVLKVWDDADNQDGVRPDSVTVKLFKTVDGEKTELMTLTLAADDTGLDAPWTHTETNLPAFEKGKPVTYSWEEEVPSGYELTATAVDKTVTKLTNSHTPDETEATVQKVWDDAEDQDGVRPKSLKVTLSNGDSVTLTADNKWTQTIEHLPKYKAGQEIEYTWTEDGLPAGYQLTSTVKSGLVTTLTNSYTPKTIQISVLKAWDDEDDVAGLRQSVAAVVTLYKTNSEGKTTAIESVVVPATDGKIKTWTDLPENEQGKKLVYSVKETLLNAYGYTTDTAESKEIKDGSITVTNSYVPEKTEATVEKLWLDENNLNNNRPEQLIVKLLANGKETGDTVTLNDENHWTDTLKDLPKYSGGKEIDYSWAEAPVKGYTQQSYRNGNKTTLINSMVVETTTVTVHKAWVDGNNLDGSRPDSIEMTLSNGMTVELNELNGWSASISGLPKYNGDDEIEYTWSEPSVPGYEAQVSKNGTVTVFTNTHIPKLGKMTAAKLWDDEDNQDGKRFDVTFQLISHVLDDEGTETITVVDEQSVGQEDGAQYEWTDLELITEEGKPIFYTVEEAGVSPDGRIGDYTVSISGTMGEGFLITNHYNPALYCIGVTKHWDDNDNADGIRPDSLTVHLSSTAGMEKDVVLNEENGWTHLERGVPMYFNNGTKIEYTWTEEEITNYTGKNQVVAGGTMTVFYNRHAPTPFTPGGGNNGLSGSKTWVDDNNAAGKRPASITVNLYANGTLVTSKKVTAADGWQWSFGDLPQQDENGQDINYTITEDAVPNYASTINGMNITNTYRAEEVTSVTVTKVWDDNNNAAGMRPANLRVTLSNGSSYVLNAGNNWTVTVNDLPKFRNGVEIAYTWSEQAVLGYKQTDVTVVGNTTIFTNTYQRPYTPTPNQTITIDDLPVALGLGVEINHVGDCFD
ncbi:MAG: Cna B-type domain-containing protein [Clostridia bacterium]|nr:Cna B-type domain-containing protein [Clostridia bacterium]